MVDLQWRRGLKLAGEEAVENCTLEGVRALRTMLSATVHDVLYYMSPVYCQEINDSVRHIFELLASVFSLFLVDFEFCREILHSAVGLLPCICYFCYVVIFLFRDSVHG